MTRKKPLKSLLATSSITYILTCGVANTHAFVGREAIINDARYSTVAGWANGNPPLNNDWIILKGVYNIIADQVTNVAGLDLNGMTGGTLTVSGFDSTMGSIFDTSGTGATLNIVFATSNKLTLNGTSTTVTIPQHNYTGLGAVNLDNNGTLYIEPSNQHGFDFSELMFYGEGNLSIQTNKGGIYAIANEDIIFWGVLGFKGVAATKTTISINTGDGNAGGYDAGGNVILNSINTAAAVNLTSGNGLPSTGALPTGNGGNITVTGSTTANAMITLTAGNGGNNGGQPAGNGGNIVMQGLVKTLGANNISVTPGTNGVGAGVVPGLGGNITFTGGLDLQGGGVMTINGGNNVGTVTIQGNITGVSGTQAISMNGGGGTLLIDSTLNPITVTGKILPTAGLSGPSLTINAVNSNNITFNDSISTIFGANTIGTTIIQGDNSALVIFNSSIGSGDLNINSNAQFNNQAFGKNANINAQTQINNSATFATMKFLIDTPLLLGSKASLAIASPIDAKTAGATIMAASGVNATLAASIDATGHTLTLGATTPGNSLTVTGAITAGNKINIAGAGSVSFANDINIPLNFNTDVTAEIATGKNISSDVTASTSNTGVLSSSGTASISGTVSGIRLIQFNTLKVVPGNFALSDTATIGTVDFNNGGGFVIANGGALTYNTFANTGGASQISITGTSSITSTGSSGAGSTLPLITTSGNATFTGNINATMIQTTGAGTISLSGAAISGGIMGAVSIGSGTSSTNTAGYAALSFTDSNAKLSILAANEINNVASVVSTAGGGTLIINGGTLPVDIATSAKPLTSLQLTGSNSTLNNNGKNIYAANIMPLSAGINLNMNGDVFGGSAGNSGSQFANISLGKNFIVSGDMYAANFSINDTVTLNNSTLNGAINLTGGSLLDATNGTFNGNITGTGDVNVGQAILSNPIGASGSNVGTVTFTPAQHTLGSNIYATSVVADNSSLILSNSVEVANLSAENLTLTPNTNSLALPNGGSLNGLTTLNITVSSFTTNATPYINVTGGALHLSNLKISVADNIGVGSSGTQVLVIGGPNDFVGTPDVEDSKLLTWTYDNSTGILSSAINQKAIDKLVGDLQGQIPNVGNYFDPGNTGDAFLVETLIANATPEQAQEIVAQLQSVSQDVAQSVTINDATLDNIRVILDQQTNDYFSDTRSDEELLTGVDLGMAAGEEENKSRRVWISTTKTGKSESFSEPAKFSKFRVTGLSASGFGGFSNLGRIKGASGSRTKTYGCSTGIDTRISERWMAGAALTYTENTTAMHNALIGSTYYSKGWVATLYGLYNVTNSLSLRTGISYGNSKNTNDARRLVQLAAVHKIAYAKYTSQFVSPDLSMSYRFALPHRINFIPSMGIQYTYYISDPYTEIGAKPLNMTVKKKPEKGVISGNIGLGLSSSFKIGNVLIKPEIHGSFRRALRGRNPTTLSKLDGAVSFISTRTHPTKKVAYSVGGSVTLGLNKTLDLGVGYDASLGEKYIAHRGSLKVRVNL